MSDNGHRAVVVDSSFAVKWLITEPGSTQAIAQRSQWHQEHLVPASPDVLLIELHNIFWKKLQRSELKPTAAVFTRGPRFGLDINWFAFEPLLPLAWQLACGCAISIYDALYAALAQRLDAIFYTADVRLADRLRQAIRVQTLARPAV